MYCAGEMSSAADNYYRDRAVCIGIHEWHSTYTVDQIFLFYTACLTTFHRFHFEVFKKECLFRGYLAIPTHNWCVGRIHGNFPLYNS
jgi:hypothetical protein